MFRFTFDYAGDIAQIAPELGLDKDQVTVIDKHGPAGGNPVVQVTMDAQSAEDAEQAFNGWLFEGYDTADVDLYRAEVV